MNIEFLNLPFNLDALEPHMSARALEIHYEKHHKKYVETANAMLKNTAYQRLPTEELMVHSFKFDPDIYNNVAQAWNHTFFWNCLSPRSSPSPNLIKLFERAFGGLDRLQSEFTHTAAKLFGSGWTWLVRDSNGNLAIRALGNAENPLVHGDVPLLTCDVWEHAYYLDYQADRNHYLQHFWRIVNWDFVETNLDRKVPYIEEAELRPKGDLTTAREFEGARATHR